MCFVRHVAGSGCKIYSFFLEAVSKTEINSVELALAIVENVGKSELIANLQREVLVGCLCASLPAHRESLFSFSIVFYNHQVSVRTCEDT